MPEYLTPGVYIEEIEIGAKPIEGVSTSTAAFLGQTERGPLEPRLVTSFDQFQRLYGGYMADSYLAYEIDGFFRNGGSRCYIARIAGGSSNPADSTAKKEFSNSGNVMRIEAVAPGENGKKISVQIDNEPEGTSDPMAFILTVYKSQEDPTGTPYNLSADPDTTDAIFPYYAKQNFAESGIALRAINAGKPKALEKKALSEGSATTKAYLDIGADSHVMRIEAATPGEDGNNISIKIEDATAETSDPLAFVLTVYKSQEDTTGTPYNLSADPYTTNNIFPYYAKQKFAESGIALRAINAGKPKALEKKALGGGDDTTSTKAYLDAEKVIEAGSHKVLTIYALGPGISGNDIQISIEAAGLNSIDTNLFKLRVFYRNTEEVYDNISIKSTSSDYYINRVNGISNLVVIDPKESYRPDNINKVRLAGGMNPAVKPEDYEGFIIDDKIGKRTGWLALNRISDISIYCEPVEADPLQKSLTDSVITHCQNTKDRFAILQTPKDTTSEIGGLWPPKDSKYAALYHPWIEVLDPLTNLPKNVPPAGHIAGIYARTDGLRGVHKAPANETVSGIVDLKFDIQREEQDTLNPRGINCIRAFPGQGIKVWGARTISRDPLWKYVNVRRLFIYLEKSIEQGTQWVVFEPNNESLWARVKQTISQFLTTVWRSGALMGTTEDEAFFVKCDRTTMTQDDIDNGRLIIVVGVAPTKPAEFVIFRIAQVANAANVSE